MIGQELSSDHIDLHFIFQYTSIPILEGRGHKRQNFFFDTVQCFYDMDSQQLLTQIFSGGKAKINLHTTLKLTSAV